MTKNLDTPASQTTSPEYQKLVADATARVHSGQLAAFRAVNKELIQLYWDLGKMIAERQQTNGWGNSVVELLAVDLQKAFPRSTGFSKTNVWRMRAFYIAYRQSAILPPAVGELPQSEFLAPTAREITAIEFLPPAVAEIGWTHNYLILEKCKDPNERLFYIHQTRRFGWTKNVLIHQIENQSFEKTVIGQQNFEQNLPENLQAQAILAVKDDYAFDFLELGEQHSEYQLEQAILQNIRQFLVEMGGDFCFIANQFAIDLNGKEYRIDLLLFHRGLQSLVAIDLKISEFEPEHTGKMAFYLSLLDRRIRKPHENPCIGIIICKSKDQTTVEFALQDVNKPIGVATYSISKTLPKELTAFFPSSEELIRRVEAVIKSVGGR